MGCKLSKAAATDGATTIPKVQTTTTARSPESVTNTRVDSDPRGSRSGRSGKQPPNASTSTTTAGSGTVPVVPTVRHRKGKAKGNNDRVYQLLLLAMTATTTPDDTDDNDNCAPQRPGWDELQQHRIVSAITPETAAYRHPDTQATPLHLAVHVLNNLYQYRHYHHRHSPTTTDADTTKRDSSSILVAVLSELIRAHPDASHTTDACGNIPLHYAIAPPFADDNTDAAAATPPTTAASSSLVSTWKVRTAVVKLLLTSDVTDCSAQYLMRHNVSYGTDVSHTTDQNNNNNRGCSPLYRVVQTLPDDYSVSHAPTLEYTHLILKAIVTASSSASSSASSVPKQGRGTGTTWIGVGNRCDGDKPLALLYRRFTRQFDLAEKFFAGDNSRPEVLEHRRNYKTAAGNTWKTMELLLKQQYQHHHQQQQHVSSLDSNREAPHQQPPQLKIVYRTVHFAVQGETPPDLLRYIVETNAEDLTVPDEAGNLPLHYAARHVPPHHHHHHRQYPTNNTSDVIHQQHKYTSFPAFYSKYVMDELLYKYPEAASKPDAAGLFPLTLAVQSGKQWIGGGIKSLYDAYPEALQQIQLTEYPALRRALSMDQQHSQQHDTTGTEAGGGETEQRLDTSMAPNVVDEQDEMANNAMDIIRDEQHDAIMLVQDETTDGYDVAICMWSHEEDAGVAMLGCVAISRLLVKQPSMNDCLRIALTAIPAVVNSMKAHPNEVIVQEKACHALQAMAAVDGQREISFVASGAVAAIVGAMQAHVSDPGVQEQACGALGRILFFGGSERATVIASVSGVTALINALAAHPAARGVQRDACRALCELTAYQDVANLPDLPRHQAEPLLQTALRTWPDDCTETVTTLLSRLS